MRFSMCLGFVDKEVGHLFESCLIECHRSVLSLGHADEFFQTTCLAQLIGEKLAHAMGYNGVGLAVNHEETGTRLVDIEYRTDEFHHVGKVGGSTSDERCLGRPAVVHRGAEYAVLETYIFSFRFKI